MGAPMPIRSAPIGEDGFRGRGPVGGQGGPMGGHVLLRSAPIGEDGLGGGGPVGAHVLV